MLFTSKFYEKNMFCLLESKPLDNHSEVLSSMFTTTMGECIAKCNEANNSCNSVYYIHNAADERNVCHHLIYEIQAQSGLTENNEKFLYYIHKCDLASNGIVPTNATSNSVYKVHLPLFKLNCYLEQQLLAFAMNSTFICQEFAMNNDLCAYFCHVRNSCNAIVFMAEENICILFHSEIDGRISTVSKQEEYNEFFLMLGCIDDAVSVTTIQLIDSHGSMHTLSLCAPDEDLIPFYNYYDANEADDNEEIMHIFHFYIQCKALRMNFSEAKEFKLHSRIPSVLSLNVCMHHCLSTGSNWVFRAVVYYEEKKICELYTKNINGSSMLSAEAQKMIKLYNCFKDRESERINNPEPLNVFFEELSKVCVVEFYKNRELSMWSLIGKFSNTTNLKKCLLECLFKRSTENCLAVAFETNTECSLFRKESFSNNIKLQQDSIFAELLIDQMYVILIISICFTTSEQTSFVAHFSDENLSCLLELRYLTQNETSALKKLPLSTLTDCIVACYMQNQSGFCNTVYFSKSRLMCYFIKQHENTFKSTDEEFRYLEIFYDILGKKNLLNDETIKKKNCNFDTLKSHVILHDVSLICYLEQRSLEETKNAIAFRNFTSSSLLSCIFFCQQWYAFVHCNAVSFSLETGNCILYHDYVPTLQRSSIEGSSTKFYSVILCVDISIKVIAIELIKGTNLNFECSTEISPEQRDILLEDFERQSFYSSMPEWVEYAASFANLYEFLEICKIKEVDPRGIKNLTLYESHLRVDSLNTCLHKCRHAISEWPYRAVHYSSEKKFCYIYVKSSGTSVNVTLEANEQFVELQRCFSDRRSDRANNPDPLAFYIKGQGEVCLVEFYEKNFLNHWKTITYKLNATNINECLLWCRQYDKKDKCSAINFAIDGKCHLLAKSYKLQSYRTLPKSLFGEILVCKPGCLTDEFQPKHSIHLKLIVINNCLLKINIFRLLYKYIFLLKFYYLVALIPQRSHSINL
ncbi:hypothetical protein T4D_5201 [Trichinella pseudospiralis]|uniref:Apple domain-containing protein n=1 Tax=Trichinella pseudospiralis TaxID=6337 RepID=A0A0V1G0P4_TRIPS|nr:hypothetical protein T4D_5201 [Trichinella pseudospiralis]